MGLPQASSTAPLVERTRNPYPRQFKVLFKDKPVRARRRCQCGTCAACLDDDKWERIFKEKFQDPDYYKPRPTRGGSSLLWPW